MQRHVFGAGEQQKATGFRPVSQNRHRVRRFDQRRRDVAQRVRGQAIIGMRYDAQTAHGFRAAPQRVQPFQRPLAPFAVQMILGVLRARVQRLHLFRQALPARGQRARRRRGRVVHPSEIQERAHAAHERQPQLSPARARVDDLHKPDLPGARRMRAAAGAELVVADLHHAHMILHRRRLSKRKRFQLLRVREPAANGHVHLNVAIHVVLKRAQLLRRQARAPIRQLYVDRRIVPSQMQADRVPGEMPPAGSGQHVLAGMLLHVIETAYPVDAPLDPRSDGQRRVHHVPHLAVLVHIYVHNVRAAQRARVVGLPAAGGVKRTAIQTHAPRVPLRLARQHRRVKFLQIGIVVIQSLRHASRRLWYFHLLYPLRLLFSSPSARFSFC